MIVQCFLILLFLPPLAATAGQFDLAEYRRVAYDATIGENFLWFAPEINLKEVTSDNIDAFEKKIADNIPDESLPNYVFITSKGGQRFACSLPEVEELKKPKPPKSSKNPKVYGEALAASFYVEKCIKLRERNSWWSYVLCRGKTVEQTHGNQGEEGFVKNILGIFDGSLTMPSYQESTEDRLLYIEESYTSGTYCELNQEPRRTTVRYECDSLLSTNEAYISSLVEVVPCQYLMIVKVGTLCHYPEFLPVTLANTKKIGCQPYLTRKDVREMLERQLEEKKKKENLKKKAALAKIAFHRAIERYNAMTKSQRNLHLPDVTKRLNAEMNYRAAHLNLLVSNLELEGETITKKKFDYMWKLFSTADIGDYMFYADYENIPDENRAHLWYYFNDPTWPKEQFPKDILATSAQNGYIEEVQLLLKGEYVFDDNGGFVEGLTNFLKTGEVDVETNLVIPAMSIYDEILDMNMEYFEMRYEWLSTLFLWFTEERDYIRDPAQIIERLIQAIMKPPKERNYYPLNQLTRSLVGLVFDEVWKDMLDMSKYGRKSQIFNRRSPTYKGIYYVLDIKKWPTGQDEKKGVHKFNYLVTKPEATNGGYDMELEYLRLLSPLYQLISIRWFQRQNPKYFHVGPPSKDYLKPGDSDDYKFHYNLARDMGFFARILTYSTIIRIENFEKWRDGKKTEPMPAEVLEEFFMTNPLVIEEEAMELASTVLFDEVGPASIAAARERLWERKVVDYRVKYVGKDHRLRKQAQSMQGLMKDLLSVKDDSNSFVSLGGKSDSKKKEIFDEKLLENLSKLGSAEDIDLETIKERIAASTDDDFFDWDDIQEVLDLLDKAGLSKKAEVQIKMFDAEGNEIKNSELDAVARSLFDENEAANKFEESEKAYLKKLLKRFEELEKEKEEGEEEEDINL